MEIWGFPGSPAPTKWWWRSSWSAGWWPWPGAMASRRCWWPWTPPPMLSTPWWRAQVEWGGGAWGGCHCDGEGMSPRCPRPPESPTLVGTVSRAQLVAFLQSHKHPQAPPGEKVKGWGGAPQRTQKNSFSTQKFTCHCPQAGHRGDSWGQLRHRARHAPALAVDLPAPGLGWGGTGTWRWEPPTRPPSSVSC